jgi:hypothetical protein
VESGGRVDRTSSPTTRAASTYRAEPDGAAKNSAALTGMAVTVPTGLFRWQTMATMVCCRDRYGDDYESKQTRVTVLHSRFRTRFRTRRLARSTRPYRSLSFRGHRPRRSWLRDEACDHGDRKTSCRDPATHDSALGAQDWPCSVVAIGRRKKADAPRRTDSLAGRRCARFRARGSYATVCAVRAVTVVPCACPMSVRSRRMRCSAERVVP